MTEPIGNKQLLAMTAEIVAAHVGSNAVSIGILPVCILARHGPVSGRA